MHSQAGGDRARRCTALFVLIVLMTAFMAQPAAGVVRRAWPLFYATGLDGTAFGGSRELIVRLEPSDVGDVRLGFFESEFFAAGEQWRAAGWMAGVVAALISGNSLSQYRISYDVPGMIDGPSAGGLMTVTLLSAMRGDRLLENATMTGTINPDGSIGPVSGIYHKLQGAKDVGKTRVLIPAGGRMEQQEDGREVDLGQRGRELGVEVIEVADVNQAYAHLTGKPLPQAPDHGQPFELPARAREALDHSYKRWLAKFNEAVDRMRETAAQVPQQFTSKLSMFWEEAHRLQHKAREALDQGNLSAAMQLVFSAASYADGGALLSYAYISYGQNGLKGMSQTVDSFLLDQAFLEQFRKKLADQQPSSVSDLAAMAEAFSYYTAAVGVHLNTEWLMANRGQAQNESEQFQLMETVVLGETVARNFFHFVDDLLFMGLGWPGPELPDEQRLEDWSTAMYRAASANLGYIEKTIVEPAANELQMAPDAVKLGLLSADQQYSLANACHQATPLVMEQMEPGFRQALAVLGGAAASFSLSSMVVAKHYCLGADVDEQGRIRGLEQPEHLSPMLGSAHKRLRQIILDAKSKGYTPVIPIFHLRSGLALSGPQSDVNDRLTALGEFWAGSSFGRLMIILGQ